jgi:hypothetical protein
MWVFHPFLVAFSAVLPLAVIGILAMAPANAIAERPSKPRPALAYLVMALGWAVVASVFRGLPVSAGAAGRFFRNAATTIRQIVTKTD